MIFSIRSSATAAAAVASAAVALSFAAGPDAASLLAGGIPRAYALAAACLAPPYLYFLINAIIIAIVASSRFSSSSPTHIPSDAAASYAHHRQPTPISISATSVPLPPAQVLQPVPIAADFPQFRSEYSPPPEQQQRDAEAAVTAAADEEEEEFELARSSSWLSTAAAAEAEAVRPAATSRIGSRKAAGAKGGGSPAAMGTSRSLKVARRRREETLESTWKAITEGRQVPLSRHMRKSETFTGGSVGRRVEAEEEDDPPPPSPSPPVTASPSGAARGVRREASVGQEELNRRVEAFIRKFNEEMRLQRQESMKQYMDMMMNHGER